ncbi:exonuclease domain-containing protein [Paenibacillus pasadenensis]|uniref:3'-5' exonuclease n=1 Tax=Paenibacillus TaxID=44249 RepID=UPI0004003811|nr:3'-5' exonuclease [Paenibacillus pasadenensis]
MDYIILDIEFNGRKFASDKPMEVIEIGAVRLDSSLRQVDEFSSLIRPVYFAKLNSFIREKTGIPQEDIDAAKGFVPVIRAFLHWLDRSEACTFVTWGGEDLKRIVLDTRMHKLDDAYWLQADYYDLLKIYLRTRGLTNDVSVEKALEELGIPAEGSAHRALDDARMTAEIFRRVFPEILPESDVRRYKDTYSNAKERRMVKNAIRGLVVQKTAPTWELVADKLAKAKVDMDNVKKAAELKAYYDVEAAKPVKPRPPRPERPVDAEAGADPADAEAGDEPADGSASTDGADAAGAADSADSATATDSKHGANGSSSPRHLL